MGRRYVSVSRVSVHYRVCEISMKYWIMHGRRETRFPADPCAFFVRFSWEYSGISSGNWVCNSSKKSSETSHCQKYKKITSNVVKWFIVFCNIQSRLLFDSLWQLKTLGYSPNPKAGGSESGTPTTSINVAHGPVDVTATEPGIHNKLLLWCWLDFLGATLDGEEQPPELHTEAVTTVVISLRKN